MGLIFDNIDLEATYGLVVDGASSWEKPARDVEVVHVPGRSGDILFDNGAWLNVEIAYRFYVKDEFKTEFETFCAWIMSHVGYFRLQDPARHPDVYRMAALTNGVSPDVWATNGPGVVELVFNCKPQQWLLSGETPVEVGFSSLFPRYFWVGERGVGFGATSNFEIRTVESIKQAAMTPWVTRTENGSAIIVHIENKTGTPRKIYICAQVEGKESVTYDVSSASSWTYTNNRAQRGEKTRLSIYCATGLEDLEIKIGFNVTGNADNLSNLKTIRSYNSFSEVLENPTEFEAHPVITAQDMTGGGALNIGDFTVTVETNPFERIVIDTEVEDCYSAEDGRNIQANSYVTIVNANERELRDFPYLKVGQTAIGVPVIEETEQIESYAFSVIPNWYRI